MTAAASGTPGIATATPSGAPTASTRNAGWSADIDALLDARERYHPNPWHGFERATWIAAADAAKARIPTLTDDQALVEIVRLAAMPDWGGRDGHTGIFFLPDSGVHAYPILLWQFGDGMFITAARAPYEKLVGSRIEAIAGRPIADILALVEPLAPRDNASNLLSYGPLYMRISELLAGLGVVDAVGPATFTLVDEDGTRSDVEIEPITVADDVAWHHGDPLHLREDRPLWLSKPDTNLWWTFFDDSRMVYIQYNKVLGSVRTVADEVLARVRQGGVDRVVVDLRNNAGGDNSTYRALLTALGDPAIDRAGRLTILIGRLTFSAAANFATDLEQTTDATFAGEAMGGSPNLYGDARRVDLPYGNQALFMATRYWQRSTADDPRLTIEPDLAIPLSSEDYFSGYDPVLDAVNGVTPVGD
ncbi:MAG: hypothetical protein ABI562_02255 [Chloroflexota bacterium]